MNYLVVLSTPADTVVPRVLASSRLRYAAQQERRMRSSSRHAPSAAEAASSLTKPNTTDDSEPHSAQAKRCETASLVGSLTTQGHSHTRRDELSLARLLTLCLEDYLASTVRAKEDDASSGNAAHPDGQSAHTRTHVSDDAKEGTKAQRLLLRSLNCLLCCASLGEAQTHGPQHRPRPSGTNMSVAHASPDGVMTAYWASTELMTQQRRIRRAMEQSHKAATASAQRKLVDKAKEADWADRTSQREERYENALIYLDVEADLLDSNHTLVLTQLSSVQHALTTVATQVSCPSRTKPSGARLAKELSSQQHHHMGDEDDKSASALAQPNVMSSRTEKEGSHAGSGGADALSAVTHDGVSGIHEPSSLGVDDDNTDALTTGHARLAAPVPSSSSPAAWSSTRRWSLLRLEPTGSAISARVTSDDIREMNHLLAYFSQCSECVHGGAAHLTAAAGPKLTGSTLGCEEEEEEEGRRSERVPAHVCSGASRCDACAPHEKEPGPESSERKRWRGRSGEHVESDRAEGSQGTNKEAAMPAPTTTTPVDGALMKNAAAYVQLLSLVHEYVCMHCRQLPVMTLTMSCCSAVLCQNCVPTPPTVQTASREDTMCPICAEIPVTPPESHIQRDRKVAALVKELRVLYLPQLHTLRQAKTRNVMQG